MAERTIKVAWFRYREQLVVDGKKVVDGNGDPVYVEKTARKDETVDIPLRADLERGEQHGLFTTGQPATETVPLGDMTDADLVVWAAGTKAADVLAAVGDDPALATRVMAAETAATSGEPRKSVVAGLQKVVDDASAGGGEQ